MCRLLIGRSVNTHRFPQNVNKRPANAAHVSFLYTQEDLSVTVFFIG